MSQTKAVVRKGTQKAFIVVFDVSFELGVVIQPNSNIMIRYESIALTFDILRQGT